MAFARAQMHLTINTQRPLADPISQVSCVQCKARAARLDLPKTPCVVCGRAHMHLTIDPQRSLADLTSQVSFCKMSLEQSVWISALTGPVHCLLPVLCLVAGRSVWPDRDLMLDSLAALQVVKGLAGALYERNRLYERGEVSPPDELTHTAARLGKLQQLMQMCSSPALSCRCSKGSWQRWSPASAQQVSCMRRAKA